MKIALVATGGLLIGAVTVGTYLVGAVGRAARMGYLVGWTEKSRNMPLTYEDFGDRLVAMQRAHIKAVQAHEQWHRDNPGKSCADDMTTSDL